MKKKIISALVFIIMLAGVVYGAQLVVDTVGTYDTPQKMMQAIDDNFDELYAKWTALGATHDTSGELDALYEAELDNSAGLLAALSDETGTGVAVFNTSPGFTTAANPSSADGAALGTTALEWSDIYLADGAVIYGQADQSNTITSSAGGWTFNIFPITPSAAPDADYEVANKKYVDDNAGGTTTLSGLGDPSENGTIDQAGYYTTWTSTLNSAGAVWEFTNTTADLTADVSFMDFAYTDDGDANGYFLRGYDNATDLKWYIGADGAFYGSSFTAAKVSGVAGLNATYEANSTDTSYIGWMGPASISESFAAQWPNAQPAAGQAMTFAAPTGTGDPNSNKVSAITWVDPIIAGDTFSGDVTATLEADGDTALTIANNAVDAGMISTMNAYANIPIAWMKDGSSAPDALDDASTRSPYAYRTFDSAADEDLNFVWFVPSDLSGSVIQFRVKYLVTNATGPSSEGVAFGLSGVSLGDNDATNGAKGTIVVVTDPTITAAQHDVLITGWSGDVTITNLAAGEVAELAFIRDVSDAADDYGQVVGVIAVELRYTKNPA